ncbi:MAG: hypothetical protein ABIV39_04375 [Verrucomicrobiota bacterium]
MHLDDDENDSFLFQRALTALKFGGTYKHIESVQETIHYLSGAKEFSDRHRYPVPDLLVLDSALCSGKTTADLMNWLNGHGEFRKLLRVVLSGEINETERKKWLAHGITCVLEKGCTTEDMFKAAEEILRQE